MAKELELSVEDFQGALLEIANSSVLALDDLWTFADPEGGGQISVLDTIQRSRRRRPRVRGDRRLSSRTVWPTRSRACPSASAS